MRESAAGTSRERKKVAIFETGISARRKTNRLWKETANFKGEKIADEGTSQKTASTEGRGKRGGYAVTTRTS